MRRRSCGFHNTSWAELHKLRVKFPYAEDPSRYNIDDSVLIGEESEIWPDVILDGDKSKLVIGKKCVIGRGAIITGEGFVGDGTIIGHGVVLKNPKIGSNCVIDGLVIESEIGDNCEIGKFAEVKRSKLAWGVKAKHSCGIRDAEIGHLTNIAAGTSILNYDGVEKFRTIIGSKCFIAGKINGGVHIGNEVRIHPEMFVKEYLPSLSYCAFGVKRNKSWYLEGFYLKLGHSVPPENRAEFIEKIKNKLGYDFSDGLRPINKNLKNWLESPILHLGNRSPIRAIEMFGCPALNCILSECDCSRKETKNPA